MIDETEDGRVRPDAQRQREHGHVGEAGVLQQLAGGEFEIIHDAEPPLDRLWSRGAPEDSMPATQQRRRESPLQAVSRDRLAALRKGMSLKLAPGLWRDQRPEAIRRRSGEIPRGRPRPKYLVVELRVRSEWRSPVCGS